MNANQIVSRILMLAALTTFIIGIITLFAPQAIIRIFDGYSAPNFHFVRYIGTALIGFSVANWLYSRFTDMRTVIPAIYGNLTSLILAIGVDSIGLISKVLSPMAAYILLLHVVFTGLFAYCVVRIRT